MGVFGSCLGFFGPKAGSRALSTAQNPLQAKGACLPALPSAHFGPIKLPEGSYTCAERLVARACFMSTVQKLAKAGLLRQWRHALLRVGRFRLFFDGLRLASATSVIWLEAFFKTHYVFLTTLYGDVLYIPIYPCSKRYRSLYIYIYTHTAVEQHPLNKDN